MIRESFLNLFKSKFKKMKHDELIILYIKSLNNILMNIFYLI